MKEATMIQVKWDETVCIHSANCVKKLPNVFKVENGQFVIDESGASEDAIRAVVAECPSGALKLDQTRRLAVMEDTTKITPWSGAHRMLRFRPFFER